MVPTVSVPWYNIPARGFPIKRWLRQRCGFVGAPLVFARLAETPAAPPPEQRRFPALVWLEAQARQQGA